MSDDDREVMALCAIRYCIGRSSYIVQDGQRWARTWGTQSPRARKVLIDDLEAAAREPYGLGAESDRRAWLEVLAELKRHADAHR